MPANFLSAFSHYAVRISAILQAAGREERASAGTTPSVAITIRQKEIETLLEAQRRAKADRQAELDRARAEWQAELDRLRRQIDELREEFPCLLYTNRARHFWSVPPTLAEISCRRRNAGRPQGRSPSRLLRTA
jgi:hypothetical protein